MAPIHRDYPKLHFSTLILNVQLQIVFDFTPGRYYFMFYKRGCSYNLSMQIEIRIPRLDGRNFYCERRFFINRLNLYICAVALSFVLYL